jgi:hypothetical protein
MDAEDARRLDIGAGLVKAVFEADGEAALDLDGPKACRRSARRADRSPPLPRYGRSSFGCASSPISKASVVLPTWRGPISAAAVWYCRAFSTRIRARLWIIIAIYPFHGRIAGITADSWVLPLAIFNLRTKIPNWEIGYAKDRSHVRTRSRRLPAVARLSASSRPKPGLARPRSRQLRRGGPGIRRSGPTFPHFKCGNVRTLR